MSYISPTQAAITGIGVRLPGPDSNNVRGPQQMWQTMQAGKTAIGRYPDHRWTPMQEKLHPQDREELPWPAALITWPHGVDPKNFGLRSSDTAHLSPTQTLVLQVVAEALDDAGLRPDTLEGPQTGIYLGFSSPDEALTVFADQARPTLPELSAGGAGMVATPVSRWLRSRGPLITYDASCAGSSYALHAARRDLADGTVTTAIVIGANILTHPVPTRAFHDGGVLATDGDVRPFDANAHGYVRGEAVVATILRPYKQARTDQDRIYALVEHTTVGADGRSAGVGMPSADALAELITRTHTEANAAPDQVPLVLTHGPGTMAGARAEARAMHTAYSRSIDDPLHITSIKGLFGHSEAAAGLTNLVAAALIMHHLCVPPTVGHTIPPTWLPSYGLRVVPNYEALHRSASTLLGVTGLGFSGAISYALLRPTPHDAQGRTGNNTALGEAAVFPLSAHTTEQLRSQAAVLAQAVAGRKRPRLSRMGDHLTRRRKAELPVRAAVVATSTNIDTENAWRALAKGRYHPDLITSPPGEGPWHPVWVFGGHGAAHPRMGRLLYNSDPVFAAHLDKALQTLKPHTPDKHQWHPTQGPAQGLAQIQRATWAVQIATACTLIDRWGLWPETVVGHSMGEVAAAHIACILSLEESAQLVCARADLLDQLTGVGGMVTAHTDLTTAHEIIDTHPVDIACINSSEDVVFAGDNKALSNLRSDLQARGCAPRPLSDSPPAHSRHVEPVMDELASALQGLRPCLGGPQFISTVTGATTLGTELDASYWVHQLRSPVQWEQAMTVQGRRGPTLVTEISPKPVLTMPTAHIRARHALDMDIVCVGTPEEQIRGMALGAAQAYVHHLPVRWPYPTCAPMQTEPVQWDTPPALQDPWPQRVTELTDTQRSQALLEVVLATVSDLAPTSVSKHDLDRDLTELGMNSFDRLTLAHRLLSPLDPRPTELPPHEPTIRSIATALELLLPGQAETA